MNNQHTTRQSNSAVLNTLQCKCPRCREGKLFVNSNPYKLRQTLAMKRECPVCGQPTEIEVGFYTGAAYVAYALTVALAVAVFVAWYVLIGFTFTIGDNRIFGCLGVTALAIVLATPVTMRLARSIWLSLFVSYEPDWKTNKLQHFERVNPIGMETAH